MKNLSEDLYFKMKKVSDEVRKDLRRKGLVVPVKNNDGSINIGRYTIVKDMSGFFDILDYSGDIVVDKINLAQTAIVLANKLALGQYKDTTLLDADRHYGYADFEEKLYSKAINRKESSAISVYLSKYDDAKLKKNVHKLTITRSFEKLIKLV